MNKSAVSRIARRAAPAMAAAMLLAGCLSVEDQVRTMREYNAISATAVDAPDHDYSVVMQNLKPLGVEMANKRDRERLAVSYLGERCPAGKTVSETELATRTPGLTSSSKDYAVRLKC